MSETSDEVACDLKIKEAKNKISGKDSKGGYLYTNDPVFAKNCSIESAENSWSKNYAKIPEVAALLASDLGNMLANCKRSCWDEIDAYIDECRSVCAKDRQKAADDKNIAVPASVVAWRKAHLSLSRADCIFELFASLKNYPDT